MTNQIAIQKSNEKQFLIESQNDSTVILFDPQTNKSKEIKIASLKKAYIIKTFEPQIKSDKVKAYIEDMEAILKDNNLPKQNKKWHSGLLYKNGYSIQQIADYFKVTGPQIRVYLVYLGLYEPGSQTVQYQKYLDGKARFAKYFESQN